MAIIQELKERLNIKTDTNTHQLLYFGLIANSNIRDGFGYQILQKDGAEAHRISNEALIEYVNRLFNKVKINPFFEPTKIRLKIKNKEDYCIWSRVGTITEIDNLSLEIEYITVS